MIESITVLFTSKQYFHLKDLFKNTDSFMTKTPLGLQNESFGTISLVQTVQTHQQTLTSKVCWVVLAQCVNPVVICFHCLNMFNLRLSGFGMFEQSGMIFQKDSNRP